MKTAFLASLMLAASASASAVASTPDKAESAKTVEVRIPFANFGGIRNFDAVEEDVVYIQDRRRNWYRAQLYGPCIGLRNAIGIGVDTRGSSSFDRFSTLVVGHERCAIHSLVRTEKPERRRRAKRS
jgi:hypothetical protein